MKSNISINDGFYGARAIATRPIGAMKYLDWNKAVEIIKTNRNSTITAGLQEDWSCTAGTIYTKGECRPTNGVYDESYWATPILDVDGVEIECYSYERSDPRVIGDLQKEFNKEISNGK